MLLFVPAIFAGMKILQIKKVGNVFCEKYTIFFYKNITVVVDLFYIIMKFTYIINWTLKLEISCTYIFNVQKCVYIICQAFEMPVLKS